MPALNFKPQFVPFILDGRKTHTIRATRKYPVKAGDTLYLYTGLRHKGAKLLMAVECVKAEQIEILAVAQRAPSTALNFMITISGQVLDVSEKEALARRDGFRDFAEMMSFWDGRLPFSGQIIHWKKR